MPVNQSFTRLETTKEVVVIHDDGQTSVPRHDVVKISKSKKHVQLSTSDRRGTYSLDRIEETESEVRVYLASSELHPDADPSEQGYPLDK